jgi:hypothetical protein
LYLFSLIDSGKSDADDDEEEEDDDDDEDDRPHKENLSISSVPLQNGQSAIVTIFDSI